MKEVEEYIQFLKNMLLFIQIFPVPGLSEEQLKNELKEWEEKKTSFQKNNL